MCRLEMGVCAAVFVLWSLLFVQHLWAWNAEKPIYKWSPVWFNYHREMDKRYNEDKPIYKWSPDWFSSYKGGRGGKRELPTCAHEMTSCVRLFESTFMYVPCCDGLECSPVGSQYVCLGAPISEETEDLQEN